MSVRSHLVVVAGALLLAAGPAWAGYQTCNGKVVGDEVRRCPDGSIPIYTSGSPPSPAPAPSAAPAPAPQPRPAPPPARPAEPNLFGVWHTEVPGTAWQTPSAVPGYNQLTISPGARAGDLTIDPNGRYVWNSYGGKSGRWERGDADYPIVLIDTVEKKRWKVGWDRDHLVIWDGYVWYVGRR